MLSSSGIAIAFLLLQSARSQDVPENFPLVDVKISMSGKYDKVEKDRYIFAIGVSPKAGKPWTVMHRFNDFHRLLTDLGTDSDTMEGAPFASRAQGSEEYGKFIADRRKTLEVWLQKAVSEAKNKLEWQEPLQKFLHPSATPDEYLKDKVMSKMSDWWGNIVDTLKTPGAEPAEAPVKEPELDLTRLDVEVSMSGESDHADKTRHVYAIDVVHASGESWQVMHRYNDFYTLSQQLGSLAKTIDGASFPSSWRNPLSSYEDFLGQRRTALASWLKAVLKHRDAKGPWAKPLLEFLDFGAAPGEYNNDFFQKWVATVNDGLDSAREQAKSIAETTSSGSAQLLASASAVAEAKYAESLEALSSAKAYFDEFVEAQSKYAAALLEQKQAEESGSDEKIEWATKKVEGAKSAMLEAGDLAKEVMEQAETLKEDMEDAALSAASSEAAAKNEL